MSIFDLLKETGYFELHNEVSVSDIRNALARDPTCVRDIDELLKQKPTLASEANEMKSKFSLFLTANSTDSH